MTPAFDNPIATQRHTRPAARLLTARRSEPIGREAYAKNETYKLHFSFDSFIRTSSTKTRV